MLKDAHISTIFAFNCSASSKVSTIFAVGLSALDISTEDLSAPKVTAATTVDATVFFLGKDPSQLKDWDSPLLVPARNPGDFLAANLCIEGLTLDKTP